MKKLSSLRRGISFPFAFSLTALVFSGFILTGLVLSGLTLSSCSSATVATSIDNTINFASYRTFAWLPDSSWQETKYDNAILERNVEQEVVRLLKVKGYVVDTLRADFLVHHHVTVENRTRLVQAPNYRYTPNMFMGRYGYYYSMYQPMMIQNSFREVEYREGTLIVDVIDSKQQRLVWRGWSEEPLQGIADFERSLQYRVQEILAKFPAYKDPIIGTTR